MIKHYWLAVDYVENSNLWTNQHRHIERSLAFMPNGGIRRLQRHGLKADGVHGKVDNLHISYDGNRINTVLEDADPVTQVGSLDYPGGKKELAFGYNEWGALITDESRGVTDISYDRFGNPLRISYADGAYTENVYSAAGEKLKATHATSLNGTVTGKTTTEYLGNVIYRDGKVDMVLFPGGYATVTGTAVTFHYYTQDYLGNNRAVINGSTGAIEQKTAYYPYGAVIADLGNPHGGQPYRFGGKELVTANGLNEYDFGARQYFSTVPHFTRIDPLCESFAHLSPYLFCGNDPVNKVDPTGEFFETAWDIGNVIYDVGAAIYHHVTGDHGTAMENWADAGFDAAAAIIPGLPAGTSKLLPAGVKTVKSLEKSTEVKKGIEKASEVSGKAIATSRDASKAKDAIKAGRSGRQARLKELGDDPKLASADRAWIKQEQKLIQQGKRKTIRNPKGKVLVHPRGKEAAKGYTYKEAQLQLDSNHKLQHKHDNNGKKNK